MVAAFRNKPRDPQLPFQQLPFQHYAQPSTQEAVSPSFDYRDDYRDPIRTPTTQINPTISAPLSNGALMVKRQYPSTVQPYSTHAPLPAMATSSVSSSLATVHSKAIQSKAIQAKTIQSKAIQSRALSKRARPSRTAQALAIQPRPIPASSQSAMVHLPKPAPYAPWVQRLMVGQKGIWLLTLTLVGCALTLYGQSVYQHRQWGQSYSQLEQLQKLEQQGMAASEIMKQSLEEEAEHPTSDMTSQMPNKAISIETAPARVFEEKEALTKSVLDLDFDGPMGY